MFSEQLPDRLNFIDSLSGFACLVCNMNIHFDNPLQSLTKQTLTKICLNSLVQFINKTTHRCGHIIHWFIVRPDDDIHRNSTVTDSLESDHYCAKSYFNVSVSKPSNLYRTVRNIANIDRPSFLAELSSASEFLLTVLDKHEPPSLRKIINHNSYPWFESKGLTFNSYERKASSGEEIEEHKVNYFQILVHQGKTQGFITCAHS